MWFPTTLRAGCPHTMARCRQFSLAILGLLLPLLLSGCGGGSSSATDEGFRFVPEGSGAVIPYSPSVHFEYSAGSVTSGAVVTAAPVTAGLPTAPGSNPTLQLSAYQVTFSTSEVAFNPQARIYLPFTPDPKSLSVARIYLYSPVADPVNGIVIGWRVLPVSTAAPAPVSGTNTLEALLPSVIESGSILAVYADTPPPVSGVPVTVTGP